MKGYWCKDLFEVLEYLVEQNVEHYRTDFNIDKETMLKGLETGEKNYIWITRESGTACVNERDAYIKESYGHAECDLHLLKQTAKTYYVKVYELTEDGKVSGYVYPVDKYELHKEISEKAVSAREVKLTPKEGEAFTVPYEEYNHKARFYYREYDVVKKEYVLTEEDEMKVQAVLRGHEEARDKAREGDLAELVPIEKEERGQKPENLFDYTTFFGGKYEVEITVNSYANNKNLYVGLNYYDEEMKCMLPFSAVTINVNKLPYLHAAIDTNDNGHSIINFLENNGFGKLTGHYQQSGFCTYPVFEFNEEKLQELCPEDFAEYRKLHGRDKRQNEIIPGGKTEDGNVIGVTESGLTITSFALEDCVYMANYEYKGETGKSAVWSQYGQYYIRTGNAIEGNLERHDFTPELAQIFEETAAQLKGNVHAKEKGDSLNDMISKADAKRSGRKEGTGHLVEPERV